MKRRVQAFVMAFLLLFATIAAPVLDAVPVNAAEDSLEIMFHYNREDGAYDNWYLYTWGGETTGDVEFKDVDGEKVATVVAGSSATSIGFIVKTELGWDNAVKDWNGDRSVDVTNYASGEIHVYIESGVEEVTVDYTKAIEKSADEMEEDETEDGEGLQIVFDYTRPDGDYGTWGLWLWDDIGTNAIYPLFEADEDGKMVITYNVADSATWVGFIVRDKDWNKDPDGDRNVDVSQYISGTLYVSLESGSADFEVVEGEDIVRGAKMKSAVYNEDNTITVTVSKEIENYEEAFTVICEENEVAIKSVTKDGDTSYILAFEDTLDVTKAYTIVYNGASCKVNMPSLYKTEAFISEYTYEGDDLGATWTKNSTTFKVWAPTASEVSLNLYDAGNGGNKLDTVAMEKAEQGVWVVTVNGDLNGTYYTYSVNNAGEVKEACDPYARTTGVNGDRAMVINLDSTDPEGWENDTNPNADLTFNDAVIYELHVRDLSIDDSSGVSEEHQGKFLGLTETGTTTENGTATALDHLVDLGITHLHLLPIYDFNSVDETSDGSNWGYDPKNYNTPEGSYSTDPYNGEVRVAEMKEMVQTLHDNGISVVMDVVYNHVADAGNFCFNQIVPNYFSRMNENGGYSSDSGCGNDTASEHVMVRKYIVDSVKYWADEYHIDGFRFDLVGLIDTITINEIMKEVWADHPDVVFYGEGWTMNSYDTGVSMTTQTNSTEVPGFAFFNDTLRDAIKGSVFDEAPGYVSGTEGLESVIEDCFIGLPGDWCTTPSQTINYSSCHDNNTLYDRLKISRPDASEEDILRMNNLAAAITITSEGIPFVHAGEEFLRSKVKEDGSYDHNSYASGDAVNSIKWDTLENEDNQMVYEYYKGLIAFRKAHAALRMTTADEVTNHITVIDGLDANVTAFAIDGGVNGETSDGLFVIFNPNTEETTVELPEGSWDVYVAGNVAGTEVLDTVEGTAAVEAISAMILVKAEEKQDETSGTTEDDETTADETTVAEETEGTQEETSAAVSSETNKNNKPSTGSGTINTGDTNNVAVYIGLMAAAIAVAAIVFIRRRKMENK